MNLTQNKNDIPTIIDYNIITSTPKIIKDHVSFTYIIFLLRKNIYLRGKEMLWNIKDNCLAEWS